MLSALSRATEASNALKCRHGSAPSSLQGAVMSFLIYLAGFAILIIGVAWGLVVAGVPPLYVAIASVILLGVGILTGVSRMRDKDHS